MNKENREQKENCLSSAASAGALHLPLQHATSTLKLRNHLQPVQCSSNSGGSPQQKIAKSFERLVDEFSLSTTCIDSSYLRNKSLENFDDSPGLLLAVPDVAHNDNDSTASSEGEGELPEEEEELAVQQYVPLPQRYHKSFVESVLLRPFKIILPNEDNGARRQRILQKFEVTEIW